jgi:hypothetical protein
MLCRLPEAVIVSESAEMKGLVVTHAGPEAPDVIISEWGRAHKVALFASRWFPRVTTYKHLFIYAGLSGIYRYHYLLYESILFWNMKKVLTQPHIKT